MAIVAAGCGLIWIAHRYRRRRLSDQTFLFDALWWSISLWASVYLMASDKPFQYLLGFIPFVLYKAVVGYGLGRIRRRLERFPDARLLYLRVFGSPRRTEKLFDLLAARWRYAGTMQVISGIDVARAQFEPDEFLDFCNGRLAGSYISSERELEERLSHLDRQRDPDARYRINEFFCHADTWQQTVTRLMAESDFLIMDLREFTPERRGCVFELGAILDDVPLSRVALLIDATTNEQTLKATLAELWQTVKPDSPNLRGGARVHIIHLAAGYTAAVRRLMQRGDELVATAGAM
jgi:hypothetical protein